MNSKILVIDDNKDILAMLEHVLTELGHRPLCFANTEILADIPEINPSIIFLDVKLLDGNGFEVCKRLKSDPKTSGIPVVLVSGSDKLAHLSQECNADGFLAKPFELSKMEDILTRLLSAKQDD